MVMEAHSLAKHAQEASVVRVVRRFLTLCLCASLVLAAASYIFSVDRFTVTKFKWHQAIKQRNSTSTTIMTTKTGSNNVLVNYKKDDYRGFLMVQHDEYGLMMLRCTRKKNKPPHWQLPGGHIDDFEFEEAAKHHPDRSGQLLQAGRSGAARELFEETGIDLRSQLDRLQPANLHRDKDDKLLNEYKHRMFFTVSVTDADFPKHGVGPMGSETIRIKLRLSVEHSGFSFQKDPAESAEMLKLHSGGKVSEAVCMFYQVEPSQLAAAGDTGIATTPSRVPTSTPSSERRSKRDKQAPADLLPPPERKNGFCCFRC